QCGSLSPIWIYLWWKCECVCLYGCIFSVSHTFPLKPQTPPVVRMFLNTTCPGAVTIRVFHGKANDPDIASTLVHGVSKIINTLINGIGMTIYQQRLHQLREAGYSTNQKAPLGISHDQSPGLPNWFDTDTSKATFGAIIKPPKSAEQMETEAKEGHQSYIHSHNAYFVSEQVDRKYKGSRYGKDGRFGVPIPLHNDGRSVSKSLHWLCDTQNAKFVSQRCDDRERIQPQISKLNACSVYVPDMYVGDLLHSTPPAEYQKGTDRQRTLVSAVRQHLKKVNFHNFNSLLQAFRHDDKKGQVVIEGEDLQDMCRQFNLDLSGLVLDDLMEYCDMDKDGLINFQEFANFLNWKNKMAISKVEQRILTSDNMQREALPVRPAASEALARPEDREPAESFSPCFSTLCESHCIIMTSFHIDYHMYGTPTVRTNLVAPQIKSVSDSTNYGDQTTAFDLLFPTLYSLRGITVIFRNVGASISEETFAEAWKLASMRHPTGDMCVEIFQDVLKEIQAN
uniref:EF-hand domain-containing protein n=1 Tax=Oncorhynchus tshawytscha TaxID=74940 RepID=A0A8C8CUI6_ONCTS